MLRAPKGAKSMMEREFVPTDRSDSIGSVSRKRAIFLILLVGLAGLYFLLGQMRAEAAPSAVLPAGFVEELVLAGPSYPASPDAYMAFDWGPDGRIFLATKSGKVDVLLNGQLWPFADISSEVNNRHDRGMLGIAVHPDFFGASPYVYLLYTYDPPETAAYVGNAGPDGNGNRVARLTRVTADASQNYTVSIPVSNTLLLGANSTWANIGDPFAYRGAVGSCEEADGTPIQDCLPADENSHTIGTVRIASDGSALFVGNGDGASYGSVTPHALKSLDVDSLAGKIMRIHPLTGDALPDNPFFDGDFASNRSKVYSYGLRNPFRFTLHPTTTEPFIGDVGWSTWEEINTGRGANFGWPCYEGGNGVSLQPNGYAALAECDALELEVANGTMTVTPAIYAYLHAGASSVNVGDFYMGNTYPSNYQDTLFYGDYNQGVINYITFNGDGSTTSSNFATGAAVVQMSVGPDTNLYYLDIGTGDLMRIRYLGGGNTPPTAIAKASPQAGLNPLDVQFDGTDSYDPDGDVISYTWGFGDGITSSLPSPSHTYGVSATFTALLTVTDGISESVDSIDIFVGNDPPSATIDTPLPAALFDVAETVNFSGHATDPEGGPLTYEWNVVVHHNNHLHFDYFRSTGTSGSFEYLDHGDGTYLELCLIVTDNVGLTDTDCVDIRANQVEYRFESIPSGLSISYNDIIGVTPFTVTADVGGQRTIGASATQSGLNFVSWSDGGARVHDITITDTNQVITAVYSVMVWDGGGATNNWSEATNWNPDQVPVASDTVIFNSSSTKDAIVDGNFAGNVAAVIVENGYTGVISMTRSLLVSGNFTQQDGTFVVLPGSSASTTQFTDFSDVSSLVLNGDAAQSGNILRITPAANNQAGTAVYTPTVALPGESSFETYFRFNMNNGSGNPADGMTFMMHNDPAGAAALGSQGSALGYQGINNSIAVELDTYVNLGSEPNNNHIAVLRNGDWQNHVDGKHHTPAYSLNDGNDHHVWVEYNGEDDQLSVFLSENSTIKPPTPVITIPNLGFSATVGSQMYVGFSGGTGGQNQNHDIESWVFTVTQPIKLFVGGVLSHEGGTLRQIAPVNDSRVSFLEVDDGLGSIKFRGAEISTTVDLGNVAVSIRAADFSSGDYCTSEGVISQPYTEQCFDIATQNQLTTGQSAIVRVWTHSSKLNGIADTDLYIYHYSGSGGVWNQLTNGATRGNDGAGFFFGEATTSSFSPFLLGSSLQPTAVTAATLAAHSLSASYWWAIVMAALALAYDKYDRRIVSRS